MAGNAQRPAYKVRTVLGGETKFVGTLRFKELLKINGRFEGSIDSSGFLIISSDAVVVADIRVGTLMVSGTVKGNVNAQERLEVLPGGKIIGNVRSPNLVMAESTGIQGRCDMLADPAGIDIFAMPPDRLKKSVGRVG